MSSLVCPKCGTLSVGRSKDEDMLRTRVAELEVAERQADTIIANLRDMEIEAIERAEQAEAALAERERMLRLAILDGEHPAGMDADYLADLRARALTTGARHVCYLCHHLIQPDQESEEWEPGYRHFECPARAEEGAP